MKYQTIKKKTFIERKQFEIIQSNICDKKSLIRLMDLMLTDLKMNGGVSEMPLTTIFLIKKGFDINIYGNKFLNRGIELGLYSKVKFIDKDGYEVTHANGRCTSYSLNMDLVENDLVQVEYEVDKKYAETFIKIGNEDWNIEKILQDFREVKYPFEQMEKDNKPNAIKSVKNKLVSKPLQRKGFKEVVFFLGDEKNTEISIKGISKEDCEKFPSDYIFVHKKRTRKIKQLNGQWKDKSVDVVFAMDKRHYFYDSVKAKIKNTQSTINIFKSGNFSASRNLTNFRLDNSFTNADKSLTNPIKYFNNFSDIDISNSQFCFLSHNIINSYISKLNIIPSNVSNQCSNDNYKMCSDDCTPTLFMYMNHMGGERILYNHLTTFLRYEDVEKFMKEVPLDVLLFLEVCLRGLLYEFLEAFLESGFGRAFIKGMTIETLFSKDKNYTPARKKFKEVFPNVLAFISDYKIKHKDKTTGSEAAFPNWLATTESELMIDNGYFKIKNEGYFCIPIHDSFIIKNEDTDAIMKILNEVFNEHHFKCAFKIKGESLKNRNEEINALVGFSKQINRRINEKVEKKRVRKSVPSGKPTKAQIKQNSIERLTITIKSMMQKGIKLTLDNIVADSKLGKSTVQRHKQTVIEKFKKFGITPTLKDIDYRIETKPVEIPVNADPQQKINYETMKQSTKETEPAKPQQNEELKKPTERYLTQEAKDKGLNELEYFVNYWGNKHDLKTAYEMYEDQFLKYPELKLQPKNLLKAV